MEIPTSRRGPGSYLKIAYAPRDDAALVDTFLHHRARSYTVDECLDFVASAGLVSRGWYHKTPYYPRELFASPSGFQPAVNALPENTIWSVMECVQTLNGCHFFMASRLERPKSSYAIDFSAPEALEYVPLMRMRRGVDGDEAFWPAGRVRLNSVQLAFMRGVEGHRRIRVIAADLARQEPPNGVSTADLESLGRSLFQSLWRLDLVAVALDVQGQDESLALDLGGGVVGARLERSAPCCPDGSAGPSDERYVDQRSIVAG